MPQDKEDEKSSLKHRFKRFQPILTNLNVDGSVISLSSIDDQGNPLDPFFSNLYETPCKPSQSWI